MVMGSISEISYLKAPSRVLLTNRCPFGARSSAVTVALRWKRVFTTSFIWVYIYIYIYIDIIAHWSQRLHNLIQTKAFLAWTRLSFTPCQINQCGYSECTVVWSVRKDCLHIASWSWCPFHRYPADWALYFKLTLHLLSLVSKFGTVLVHFVFLT